MSNLATPFFFSNAARDTVFLIQDIPHLGFIHLSNLSLDELKGLAQFFNLMAEKYAPSFVDKVITISFLAIGVIFAISGTYAEAELRSLFYLGACSILAVASIFLGYLLAMQTEKSAYIQWRDYSIEMLDLKLGPISS